MFWIGSENGLYKFDKATGKFASIKFDSTDSDSIPISVQSIYEDKEGSLWFGTGRGLEKLDFKSIHPGSKAESKQEKFTHCRISSNRNDWNYLIRSVRIKFGTSFYRNKEASIIEMRSNLRGC